MPYMKPVDDVEPAEAIARTIGRRVRAGRIERGWTLDVLAQRSGVSRRMLVNVEQGTTNPSIATLLRLADALGIGLPALVGPDEKNHETVTVRRASEAPAMWTSPAGGSAVMVAGTPPPDVIELWDWRLSPGDEYRSDAHRDGTRELLLVLSGTVDLVVGDTTHTLRTGDSADFEAGAPHAYRNPSTSRRARFCLAVYEPDVGKETP